MKSHQQASSTRSSTPGRRAASFITGHRNKHRRVGARRQSKRGLRTRVVAAFRDLAHGCSPQTALARTKAFYRSSGADCTRHLT